MAGDRMARVWSPTTTIGPIALTGGNSIAMILVPGAALVTTQERRLRDWTVTRIVGSLQFTSTGTTTFYYGVRVYNEHEASNLVLPGDEPTSDWMYWGGITTNSNADLPRDPLHRRYTMPARLTSHSIVRKFPGGVSRSPHRQLANEQSEDPFSQCHLPPSATRSIVWSLHGGARRQENLPIFPVVAPLLNCPSYICASLRPYLTQ